MTFNNISAGDPGNAAPIMQNFRHINYGNDLIPVNSSGSGVDNTLDLGSATYRFKDAFFSGDMTVDTNTLFVDSNNNRVGVKTVSPSQIFHVAAGAVTSRLSISGKADNSVFGNLGYSNGNGAFLELHDESANLDVVIRSYGDSYFNGGNIGIGTDIPRETLDVRGDLGVSTAINFDMTTNGNANGWINQNGYLGGSTQYRDLSIGDGAGSLIAFFDGSTGNVGIGTDTPSYLSHFYQSADSTDPLLLIQNDNAGSSTVASMRFNVSGQSIDIGVEKSSGSFKISDGALGTNDRFVIDSTGNVGIGIDAPGYTLDVEKSVNSDYVAKFENTSATNPYGFLINVNGNSNSQRALAINNNSDLIFTVQNSGNVGINTTGPDRKLDILDASNPQLRLTHTDGSVYSDFQTNASGHTIFTNTSNNFYLQSISGNLDFILNNDSHGDNTSLTFNAENASGTPKTAVFKLDPDLGYLYLNGDFRLRTATTPTFYLDDETNIASLNLGSSGILEFDCDSTLYEFKNDSSTPKVVMLESIGSGTPRITLTTDGGGQFSTGERNGINTTLNLFEIFHSTEGYAGTGVTAYVTIRESSGNYEYRQVSFLLEQSGHGGDGGSVSNTSLSSIGSVTAGSFALSKTSSALTVLQYTVPAGVTHYVTSYCIVTH